MNYIIKKSLTAAAVLGLFSLVGTGLVSMTFHSTKEKISENERAALLRNLSAIVPKALYDNDIVNDTITVTDKRLGSLDPITVYRARKMGKPVSAIFTTIAPGGYNGKIKLLVAVKADGSLAGVRVVAHKETPGLGDNIEVSRSDWILHFAGKSLHNPAEKQWAVKRDGGSFDQFTGATITPRAIVKAVKNTLLYFQRHQAEVFAPAEHRVNKKDSEEAK